MINFIKKKKENVKKVANWIDISTRRGVVFFLEKGVADAF